MVCIVQSLDARTTEYAMNVSYTSTFCVDEILYLPLILYCFREAYPKMYYLRYSRVLVLPQVLVLKDEKIPKKAKE